jgi:hypothetical protein
MIRRLAQVRLSWSQVGLVALASAIATVVVIAHASPGRTPLQAAVLAALERQRIVVHHVGGPSGGATGAGTSSPSVTPVTASSSAPSTAPSNASSGGGSWTPSSTGTTTPTPTTNSTQPKTYKVKHVFVIALSTASYSSAFGHGSVARYLNRTLVPRGTLLTGYRTVGSSELADKIAMISGQAPNADTGAGCSTYDDFPGTAKPDRAGMVAGNGCVYPDTVLTIGDQVTAAGNVWKAYLDGMGSAKCVHPNSGAADNAVLPGAGSEYDTRHNPFIYFHSLLDLGDCAADDEPLTQLPADLASATKTPAYSFIAPGLCADSAQTSCPGGSPGGLAAEDAFLSQWVPKILDSKAYKQDGALIITFAISKPAGSAATGTTGPAGAIGPSGAAGARARAGALVISPYTSAGAKVSGSYDPYSLLRSVEDLFGFSPVAHAAQAKSFLAAALPHG